MFQTPPLLEWRAFGGVWPRSEGRGPPRPPRPPRHPRHPRHTRGFLAFLACMALVVHPACSDSSDPTGTPPDSDGNGGPPPPPPPPEVASVSLEPGEASVQGIGITLTFTAEAVEEDGSVITDDPADFEWSSSDPEVAVVSAQGVATTTGEGTVVIRAEIDEVEGAATLEVQVTQPGDIPDNALANAVRDALGTGFGQPIDPDELAGLTELEATNLGVQSLEGLQFATSLEVLNLRQNPADLSLNPLAGLENLRELDLSVTGVTDLGPLAQVHSLANLRINSAPVEDLSPLTGHPGLELISVIGIPGRDFTPLSTAPNLFSFSAAATGLEGPELEGLVGAPSLRWLFLANNEISDLSALAGFPEIEVIQLQGNPFSDLTPLAELTRIESLNIGQSEVEDLTPLAGLTTLETLNANGGSVSDVSPLTGLENLRDLFLVSQEIEDLGPLAGSDVPRSGGRLALQDNPLSQTSRCQHVPAIEARGVQVFVSEGC